MAVFPCWQNPGKFLKVYGHSHSGYLFSLTLYPKTYWLKKDYIMGTSCLGNFCFPDRLAVFPSISGGRTGLRGPHGFLFIPGVLNGVREGRYSQNKTMVS